MGACFSKKKKRFKTTKLKRKVYKKWNVVLEVTRLSTYYPSEFYIGQKFECTEYGMPTSDRYRNDGKILFGRGYMDGMKDIYFSDADRYCSKSQAKIVFDK
jgi:hypothetical protein